jgi:phosphoribosylglycinamide formyltransferase 1
MKNVELMLVVSNNSRSGALEFARVAGIHSCHLSTRTHVDLAQAMLDVMYQFRIDLIVLAGYMRLLPKEVVEAYAGRILNIHPALLPEFGGAQMYGLRVHEAVIADHRKLSGATVHLVTNSYDEGQIVMQQRCEVREDDTPRSLQERVQQVEYDLYPKAIAKIAAQMIEYGARNIKQ